MSRPIAAPRPDAEAANARLKGQASSILWTSLIVATAAHLGTFAFWPEMTASAASIDTRVTTAVNLSPDFVLPEPPDALQRPAVPVLGPMDIGTEATIAPTHWDANPRDVLRPPPAASAARDDRAGRIIPFTVRPEILNATEVQRELSRLYPPSLRDAGIGGRVELSIHIDENGQVLEAEILSTSGHRSLDAAALELADGFRFSPALNRDKRVAVWVTVPVTFEVRKESRRAPTLTRPS